jgi:hypothetical protein
MDMDKTVTMRISLNVDTNVRIRVTDTLVEEVEKSIY